MVVMVSEFGRTPRVNTNAGRDHWSRVFSVFFAGGGVKPGTVVGASDIDGMYPDSRPVKPQDIPATICHALGADWTKTVITPQERPFKLTQEGSDQYSNSSPKLVYLAAASIRLKVLLLNRRPQRGRRFLFGLYNL